MVDGVLENPSGVTETQPGDIVAEEDLTRLGASADDPVAVWEELLRRGWSDGLPVIPPTPERVEAMLGGRRPDSGVSSLGIDAGARPLAKIAANAVMAGCAPDYFPAVLAALQAAATGGLAGAFANAPCAPLLVFNGPVRRQLDLNCSHEMLSMTTRANATIGRAVRLVFMNLLGAKVPRLFDVQHGMPGRMSMVFGELEEESPWEPHSVSHGVAVGRSAVTAFAAIGTMPVNYHQVPQRSSELLLILKRCMDYVRGNRIGPSADAGAPVVVLSPKHVRAFSIEGWTKERLEDELSEAVNDHYDIELVAHSEKIELINRGRDPDEARVIPTKPEGRVQVLVAGGVAGWHSLMIPTLAWGTPTTVAFDE
jgi:hypothetical protein